MGKYNVGYHGPAVGSDIQGIATLTYNPIAKDNVGKDKKGSKPRK